MFTASLPVTVVLKSRDSFGDGINMAFIFGIAFSLLPVSIISYLINER